MNTFQLVFPYHHTYEKVKDAVERRYGTKVPFRILKKSIDARQHRNIKVQYSVSTDLNDPVERLHAMIQRRRTALERSFRSGTFPKVVVVGTGPGGLFCAYWLHLHGFKPIVVEQGPPMKQRVKDMALFMKQGKLNPYSNIGFGAGGAGTYSDGKLITRIRSPYIGFVMETFVRFGAPENIRYVYNPHLGSNKIRQCIARMIETLSAAEMEFHFDTRLVDLRDDESGKITQLETSRDAIDHPDAVFAATGHSSRETYAMFRARQIEMTLKEFAMGLRVEHTAECINEIQYGKGYTTRYAGIETAQYKLAHTWREKNRGVYSFCMCPGGFVLNASTDTNGVVTNGMSNFLKSGRFSNSAIVVNISKADLAGMGFDGIDAGLSFQNELEERFRRAVNPAGWCNIVPGQRLLDFLQGERSKSLSVSSCLNPVKVAALHTLLPEFMSEALRSGVSLFNRKMPGFISRDAQVFGIESRTSSPYRIERDPGKNHSTSHPNLYPVGEGAGHAGGITSAAVDGIRCAQAYIGNYIETENFTFLSGKEL